MYFFISLGLAIYLGMNEIRSYGKLVPSFAVMETKISKILPLVIQRIASFSVAGSVFDFLNQGNNTFIYVLQVPFLILIFYFGVKVFFLLIIISYRIVFSIIDENPKKYK